jgi:hypothetical protein
MNKQTMSLDTADEIEKLRKDADRYRWLRDMLGTSTYRRLTQGDGFGGCNEMRDREKLDAAIDAIMNED